MVGKGAPCIPEAAGLDRLLMMSHLTSGTGDGQGQEGHGGSDAGQCQTQGDDTHVCWAGKGLWVGVGGVGGIVNNLKESQGEARSACWLRWL